jgi:transposase
MWLKGSVTPLSKNREELQKVRELLGSYIAEGRVEEAIEMAMSVLIRLAEHNHELMLKLAQLRRDQLGKRSEKIDSAQLAMMLELCSDEIEEAEESTEPEPDLPAIEEKSQSPRKRPRRRRPPKDLPRDVIRHELDEQDRLCERCTDPMVPIGDDVSEILELVPAHFRVQEHHRTKYGCPRCKEFIKTAPGPAKLIDKGLPGPGLLAHVVQSKYQDHVPLHRLSAIYERAGVDVAVSTMCGWVGAVADEFKPIVDRIWEKIQGSHVVQADGSGLKVLDRDDPEGIRLGTMWCYVGDRRHVVFRYSKTGSGEEGPWNHLAGRVGYIQVDAASVFDRLFNGQVALATEVGCNVHARRKYYKLKDTDPRVAYPLKLIGDLYKVERSADSQGLSGKSRASFRARHSTGVLKRLKRWLKKTAASEPPESAMHKACAYSLNHWEALTRFLEDGDLQLDNNLCELQIRSLAVGRRNYLFAGSDLGAERAATLYSLLRTCALQGVDTYAYLVDTLKKLAEGWLDKRIDELLPEAWASRHPSEEPVLQATA